MQLLPLFCVRENAGMKTLHLGFSRWIRALLVALAATLVFSQPLAAQQAKGGADKEVFHPARILVKFKPGVQVVHLQRF